PPPPPPPSTCPSVTCATGEPDVTVDQRNITLNVRDNQNVDGDTIDIILNGILEADDLVLTGSAQNVAVRLCCDLNDLTIRAVSCGPGQPNNPCTVELTITPIPISGQVNCCFPIPEGDSHSLIIEVVKGVVRR
ncbi:MAG: hypothetical protein ACE5JO_01420, partial [Candidatus Binatia bacterium]